MLSRLLARSANPLRNQGRKAAVCVAQRNYLDVSEFLEEKEQLRCGSTDGRTLIQPIRSKNRFHSPWDPNATNKSFMEFLYWMYTRRTPKVVSSAAEAHKYLPIRSVDLEALAPSDETKLTWIGHATFFGQMEGFNFLTDPVWSARASPLQFIGPKRFVNPPIELEQLPKVDVVFISHTHYDHLDYGTIRRLMTSHPDAKYIVPIGLKRWFTGLGITNVEELNWWDTIHLRRGNTAGKIDVEVADKLVTHDDRVVSPREGMKVTFVPAQHWTSRHPFDKNTSLWGGFALVSKNHRLLFTGDTSYCDVFKTVGEVLGPFDTAMIPIGAYKPRWFLRAIHCNPAEAVKIHLDVKAKQTVAMHWGTFSLADEDYDEPALELARARNEANLTADTIFTMGHGETWTAGQAPTADYATLNPSSYEAYLQICQERQAKEARLDEQVLKWFGKAKGVEANVPN